jgi:hypothetical protein
MVLESLAMARTPDPNILAEALTQLQYAAYYIMHKYTLSHPNHVLELISLVFNSADTEKVDHHGHEYR